MKVLNVGGGTSRQLPAHYDGWTQLLMDIDPAVKPDICKDAKDLQELQGETFDAVYCSHNLEHFYKHDVPVVLKGFLHVLNDEGFAEIHVPNLPHLFRELASRNQDLDDVWYRISGGAPVTYHDVLYGWNEYMRTGNLFYSHKCGFTAISLHKNLSEAGFGSVFVAEQGANLMAKAYKKEGVPCPT